MSSRIIRSGGSGLRPHHRPSKAVALRKASASYPSAPVLTDLIGWYKPHANGYSDLDPIPTLTDFASVIGTVTADVAEEPYYDEAAGLGYGAAVFSGAQALKTTSAQVGNPGATIFAVMSISPSAFAMVFSGNDAGDYLEMRSTGSGSDALEGIIGAGVAPALGTTSVQVPKIWCLDAKPSGTTDLELYNGLSLEGSNADASSVSFADVSIGGRGSSLFLVGTIWEILVYNKGLVPADRILTTNYLKGKYGL